MDWFRLWHGTPVDGKLSMIARQSGARRCEMTALWECLLDYASQQSERGAVAGIDLEVIAFQQEIDYDLVLALYAGLERKGVIACGKLVNWNERQPQREDGSAERARAWRERKQAERVSNESTQTQPNAAERTQTPVNAPDIDRDIDLDPPFIPPPGDATEHRLNAVPKEQSAAAPKTARKRPTATALPDDFTVTEEMAEWATEQGVSTAEIRKQTEKFKSGALAHGRRYSDWEQAWRNWILNIDTYEPQRNGAQSNGANGSYAGGYVGPTIMDAQQTKAYADEIRAIRAAKQAARAGPGPPAS